MLSSILNVEFSSYKYFLYLDKIKALMEGKEVLPIFMELEIYSSCNHQCNWCKRYPTNRNNVMMSIPIAKKIIKEAHFLGIDSIVFNGTGESTLHRGFDEMIQTAGNLEMKIGVITHGGNLNEPKLLNSLARDCFDIRISIDGPTPKYRKITHGVDDFDSLTSGIEKLLTIRGSKRHPVIGASFCLDYEGRLWVDQCIQLADRLGLDYVLIHPPYYEEKGLKSPFTSIQSAELRKEIRRAVENYSGKVPVIIRNWMGDKEMDVTSPEKRVRELAGGYLGIPKYKYNGIEHVTHRCIAPNFFLFVSASGDVYGCPCLYELKEYNFGRIDYDRGFSLREILDSLQREKRLKKMYNVECLKHCTHPMEKLNELIEYLTLPEEFHSPFI